jgi:hypothetical protein
MITYDVQTFDDMIPDDLRWRVWEYIQNCEYIAATKDMQNYGKSVAAVVKYVPAHNKKEYLAPIAGANNHYMHRTTFGDNEDDLKHHPIILELWNVINNNFNNEFIIDGDAEGIADIIPRTSRVYVNAQPNESIKRSHGIHRDSIDLEDDSHYTLLYMANLKWYPSWMGENVFYCDDETTGDKQQFQKGFGQSRNFNVGYPYAIIPPKEGRVILYDGRALHTTKPTSAWAEQMRYAVVFRIRRK